MPAGQLTRAIHHIRRLFGAPAGGDLNDRQLLELFAESDDQEAFTTLVQRHGPLVWGVCRRVLDNDADAEDAFQATFWVLARKAHSVRWHDSVANWLYGVAFRTAQRARTKAGLRRRHEQQAGAMIPSSAETVIDWSELRQVLDEELLNMPAKYRMPLLLCYLHGKTRDEAAEELGWSAGAVKGCLERGREMLRDRLARRGLTLSAVLLPTLLAQGTVTAAPVSLVTATITAVAAGTMSAPVAALSQGVMQAMFWKTVTMWTFLFFVIGLVGGGAGMVLYHGHAGGMTPLPEQPKKPPEAVKASEPVVKDGLAVTVTPVKARFAADEQPSFTITYLNKTEKLFRLHDLGFEVSYWVCTDTGSGFPWKAGPYVYSARPAGRIVDLGAGMAEVQPHKLRGPFADDRPQRRETVPSRETLAPGKYRVTAKIVFAEVRSTPVPCWSGEVTTNPVEFEIAAEKAGGAKASEPAVKDGLAVTVKPAKAVFAADELPSFEFTYTNRSEKAFRLYDIGRGVHDWVCRRVHKDEDGPWESYPKEREGEFQTVLLEAGKSVAKTYTMQGPFVYQGKSKMGLTRQALPSGKYELEVYLAINFYNKVEDKDPVPLWSGLLTVKRVEFEIAAEKPAGNEGQPMKVASVSFDGIQDAAYRMGGSPPFPGMLVIDNSWDLERHARLVPGLPKPDLQKRMLVVLVSGDRTPRSVTGITTSGETMVVQVKEGYVPRETKEFIAPKFVVAEAPAWTGPIRFEVNGEPSFTVLKGAELAAQAKKAWEEIGRLHRGGEPTLEQKVRYWKTRMGRGTTREDILKGLNGGELAKYPIQGRDEKEILFGLLFNDLACMKARSLVPEIFKLIDGMQDHDPAFTPAWKAMVAIGGAEVVEGCRKALQSSNRRLRQAAILTLRDFGLPDTREIVHPHLGDPYAPICRGALGALNHIGLDAKDVPALAAALANPTESDVLEMICWTLGTMGPQAKAALPALQHTAEKHSSATVRKAAQEALNKLRRPE